MANTAYKTAGLPISKDEAIAPGSGVITAYKTAGLAPAVIEIGGEGGPVIPVFMNQYRQRWA